MSFKAIALAGALCASLGACGGGHDDTIPQTRTLGAGQSFAIGPNQTFYVPSDTLVETNGSKVTITGHKNTVTALVGAVVSVAADASGPADNLVVSHKD